jgi:hypothetical protein
MTITKLCDGDHSGSLFSKRLSGAMPRWLIKPFLLGNVNLFFLVDVPQEIGQTAGQRDNR